MTLTEHEAMGRMLYAAGMRCKDYVPRFHTLDHAYERGDSLAVQYYFRWLSACMDGTQE